MNSKHIQKFNAFKVRFVFLALALFISPAYATETLYFYHNDHLGTPQVMTDDSQTVVWQADYKPFGEATITVATVENNLRFPGQYFDAESGLHYNYFRDYDPSIGRYTQSDPIGLSGGINAYAYAGGNPIIFGDPLGLEVTINITRFGSTGTSIFGTFNATSSVTGDSVSGYTLENVSPPNPNLPAQPGSYQGSVRYDRKPPRIQLEGVPGASGIQIHNGNWPSQVVGCFLVGTNSSSVEVLNSVDTLEELVNLIENDRDSDFIGGGGITINISPGIPNL